jgi:hypothetical protein
MQTSSTDVNCGLTEMLQLVVIVRKIKYTFDVHDCGMRTINLKISGSSLWSRYYQNWSSELQAD